MRRGLVWTRLIWALCLMGAALFSGVIVASDDEIVSSDLGPTKNLFKIERIEIRGTKKVEAEAVLEKIGAKEGMMLDNYLLRKDIQRIYGMKYFESVEAQQDVVDGKNTLVFMIKENPIIQKIEYKGNNDISDEDITAQVKTKEYSILDVNSIKTDMAAIQKHYEEKGYYLASVDYEIKKTDAENVDVIFKIKEYDKVRVKKVMFLGNTAFSDDELKSIMETREESLLSFFNNSGNFKEFNFQTDVERVKYFYKTKGYLQVNVGSPDITVSEDKKWVFISLKVTEGPKFSVNKISFSGDMLFTEEELSSKIRMKENDIYNEENLRLDIQQMTEMFQDEGYAFANVLRTLDIVPGENKVDVHFSFEKGKMAYFGNISVKGNTKTRDKVVRRELKIYEGMRYSGSLLRKSKENVNRLGFFEQNSVVFNTVAPKGKDDVLDVEITVKERNTGQITLGAGYSTVSKGFLQASIAQNNFRGLGQVLSFSLQLAENNQSYNVGFTEPYLFDSEWSGGADIFRTINDTRASHSMTKQGFDLRVGHPVAEYTRLFLTYKLEETRLKRVTDPTIDADLENGYASSVQTSLVRDKRNNSFEPTDGSYLRGAVEYTGVGGDQRWVKSEAEGRYFYKVFGDLVFRSRLSVSHMAQTTERNIPRSERFVLGGSRNLRGYNFEDIGPLETRNVNGVNYTFNTGGLFSLVNTYEFEHPLVREAGLKWVTFFDAGNVNQHYYGDTGTFTLRTDYGFGLRWFSPIGVLRFEFGFPIAKRDRESPNQFYFDIGQLF